MSQSRTRKAPAVGNAPRARPLTKASNDAVKPQQPQQSHRSKSKIPKSVRYDLENALVGLCDVWFEDIKPHLLRNNIKVHVHGASAGEAGAGGGDQRGRLPPGAPGCSHLDPGAASDHCRRRAVSSVDFCSTQPTASRAPYRRPRRLPFKPLSPLLSPQRSLTPENPHPSHAEDVCFSPVVRVRRRRRRNAPSWQPVNYVVPRLCQTISVPSHRAAPATLTHTASQHKPQCNSNKPRPVSELRMPRYRKPLKKPRMRHKATQTPGPPLRPKSLSPPRRNPSPKGASSSPPRRKPSPVNRRPATTTFFPSHNQTQSYNQEDSPPLFQDDLIDIIGKNHEMIVKMLYQSPRREECPSTMNLIRCSPKRKNNKTLPPWR